MNKFLKQVKKYIAKKNARPVLKAALVNEEYIIATDSYKLIRVKHHEKVEKPYLHYFNEPDIESEAQYYPELTEFIPNTWNAERKDTIYLKEWIEAHSEALVVAKQNKNNQVIVRDKTLIAKMMDKEGNIITYQRSIVSMPGIEETGYDCKNMLEALKVFKILKERPTFYWYGPMKPMLLASENIEILIVPIRVT